ncbi:SurA N-terminal domain-containing protein [Desulfosarcina ovata]|uniref:SurA N-terminal domain-containing protein n=1 Tax=Desulfosarcina ovata subsp. ovata TaxID=2752305 RepID=A0A5K8AKU0_9BACT|nr:SurA N-terminal domain-containing protein [Desulfosarcina ovata]BBO93345.1 hypothetical protein DSCOOX_65250 [Desulfosarcina ovata subsp. ovata]
MKIIFRKVAVRYQQWRQTSEQSATQAGLAVWFLLIVFLAGCTESESPTSAAVLIQANGQRITLTQFERAFDVARIAFSDDRMADPQLVNDGRLRLLHQMTEEVAIRCRADELGMELDDQEVTAAIDAIKKDYPEGEFEQMLLESAITLPLWRERLAARLLMEKVVNQDLIPSVTITPKEIETYYRSHPDQFNVDDETVADTNLKHRIITHLRQEKVEAAWPQWMNGLKTRYRVKINWELWKQAQPPDAGSGSREKEK